jgi:RNA polymerase-associated protein RTF1
MDESDSDSDASPTGADDEIERFPIEGKYLSHADKAEIMAMPEIKREELLAERAQQVVADRQRRAIRQLLNVRDAGKKRDDKKRKADSADLDESKRKTARQRTKVGGGRVGEVTSGIDNLKRARAEKDDRQRRRQEDKDRNRDHRGNAQEDYSDADADGESEVEWDDGKPKDRKSPSPDHRDAQPADCQDVDRVRVGRSQFALVCFYPGFNEAITGCFVRINVGPNKETGDNVYRMGLIKGRLISCRQV